MTPLEYKLVRRLLFEPDTLSRNRNFHTFTEPSAKRARRVAAHLRSVRDAVIEATGDVDVARVDGSWQIRVADPNAASERTAFVSDDEMALLREDDAFTARLDAGAAT